MCWRARSIRCPRRPLLTINSGCFRPISRRFSRRKISPAQGSWTPKPQVGLWAGLGMLGVAALATAEPEPVASKTAAVLLWTSILAGTTGASISMIQRHAEGMSTGMEDALDTLTIAGNLLGAR